MWHIKYNLYPEQVFCVPKESNLDLGVAGQSSSPSQPVEEVG